MKLLPFQEQAANAIKKLFATQQRVLLQSATASGKTVIAASIIRDHLKEAGSNRVLCLVNLQALIGQFYTTVEAFGNPVSVLHDLITRSPAGDFYKCDPKRRVLLTMPETYLNTINNTNGLDWNRNWRPTLIVIDEAHKGTSSNFQIIRDLFPTAKILGLTATPYREKNGEGESLTEWYGNNLVTTTSVDELIKLGRLVQPRYFEFPNDTHMVDTWKRLTEKQSNNSTIVFTKNTRHSFAVKDAFLAQGIAAEVITAGTDTDPDFYVTTQTPLQRQRIYDAFEAGEIKVLISVNALCEGFDCPRARFCLLLRTVGNHALYHQMVGRVLRAHETKSDAYVVDFERNIAEHGFVEHYAWSLTAPIPNNAFVRDSDSTMTRETLLKKTGVFYCCDRCSHVYDIKKTAVCTICRTPHNVKVVERIDRMFEIEFGKSLDKPAFQQFTSRYSAARTGGLVYGTPAHVIFKKQTGLDIFDATGQLNEKYVWLDRAIGKSPSDLVQI